jgi:hypothetical protein
MMKVTSFAQCCQSGVLGISYCKQFSSITVLGGGVTGISIVAMMVDEGHHVTWIDENHSDIGRLGRFYSSGVPANTPNHVLVKGLQGVDAFNYSRFLRYSADKNLLSSTLSNLQENSCADLKYLYEPLHFASSQLQAHPRVNSIKGKLIRADFSNASSQSSRKFTICTPHSDQCVTPTTRTTRSELFFIAQGAKPVFPFNIPASLPHQSVDIFVNSHSVRNYMEHHDGSLEKTWAVVGSSHRWGWLL